MWWWWWESFRFSLVVKWDGNDYIDDDDADNEWWNWVMKGVWNFQLKLSPFASSHCKLTHFTFHFHKNVVNVDNYDYYDDDNDNDKGGDDDNDDDDDTGCISLSH